MLEENVKEKIEEVEKVKCCLGCAKKINGNGIRLKALSSRTVKDDVYLNLIFSDEEEVCGVKCVGRIIQDELALRIVDLVMEGKMNKQDAAELTH